MQLRRDCRDYRLFDSETEDGLTSSPRRDAATRRAIREGVVMKCDDSLILLEEYLDGELAERDAKELNAHLTTCTHCTTELEALTAENEVYTRYDRELEISPVMWNAIAARTFADPLVAERRVEPARRNWFAGLFAWPRLAFVAPAMVALVFAVVMGVMLLGKQETSVPQIAKETVPKSTKPMETATKPAQLASERSNSEGQVVIEPAVHKAPTRDASPIRRSANQSDVIP